MNREAQILLAMQSAPPGAQRALAAELHQIRTGARHQAVAARDMVLAEDITSAHLTPVVSYVRHSAETDWLDKDCRSSILTK